MTPCDPQEPHFWGNKEFCPTDLCPMELCPAVLAGGAGRCPAGNRSVPAALPSLPWLRAEPSMRNQGKGWKSPCTSTSHQRTGS